MGNWIKLTLGGHMLFAIDGVMPVYDVHPASSTWNLHAMRNVPQHCLFTSGVISPHAGTVLGVLTC